MSINLQCRFRTPAVFSPVSPHPPPVTITSCGLRPARRDRRRPAARPASSSACSWASRCSGGRHAVAPVEATAAAAAARARQRSGRRRLPRGGQRRNCRWRAEWTRPPPALVAPTRSRAFPVRDLAACSAPSPVRRIYCVGRNRADHAREMGAAAPASKAERGTPVFFMKPADAIVVDGGGALPARHRDLHHEVELVVALGPRTPGAWPVADAAGWWSPAAWDWTSPPRPAGRAKAKACPGTPAGLRPVGAGRRAGARSTQPASWPPAAVAGRQ